MAGAGPADDVRGEQADVGQAVQVQVGAVHAAVDRLLQPLSHDLAVQVRHRDGVHGLGGGERGGTAGLLGAAGGARDHQGRGVRGQDLGGGVVAAHADGGRGVGEQGRQVADGAADLDARAGDAGGADDRGGARVGRDGVADAGLVVGGHLRAGDDDVAVAGRDLGLGGGEEDVHAVRAAAHGGEDVGGLQRGAVVVRAAAGEQAGEAGELGQGRRDLAGGGGVVDVAVAVHPEGVVVGGDLVRTADLLPLGLHGGGGVQHVAHAEDGGGAVVLPQLLQGRLELAVHAERVAVRDEQVRGEGVQGGGHDLAAHVRQGRHGHADVAGLVAAGGAGVAGQQEPVPAVRQGVLGGVRVAGDQHAGDLLAGELRQGVRQCPGQCTVAPCVTESHRVMGVENHADAHGGTS